MGGIPSSKRPARLIRRVRWLAPLAVLGTMAAIAFPTGAFAVGSSTNSFDRTNLISDLDGVARITDPNLVNPWGMAAGAHTPLWVADNGADVSTLYTGGVNGSIPQIVPLVVSIPGGEPTGIVWNPTNKFALGASGPAKFIFDSEAGKITAWSPGLSPVTQAVVKSSSSTAVYKGLAFASNANGSFIYAANFHDNEIDVWDQNFQPASLSGDFTDPNIPAGFAPFDIQLLNGKLYVSYAKQDADKHDDVAGAGNGFVDMYNTNGHLIRRLISHGALNSPWGLVIAPAGFGPFGGDLLVGNFGDGAIHAYDPNTGAPKGGLKNSDGNPLLINGLWALRFGNGVAGTPDTLLFTAGIGGESHGLFGEIAPS
jgi:uncharacterized protein (TIGR03118 family)